MSKFYEKYMNGEVTVDDLDDYLDEWNKSTSNESIEEYLGLTEEQYYDWCTDPKKLEQELDNIKNKERELVMANENIKIARQLVKIAKELVVSEEWTDDKIEKYLDDIEEYCVSERLAKHNWRLYDFAINVAPGDYEYGRVWSVEEIPEEEQFDDREVGTWEDIANEFKGDFEFIDNGPKVHFDCDEYGPSGYRILGGFNKEDF